MLNSAVENGITPKLGEGEGTEGSPGRARGARMGDPKGNKSQRPLSQWHGNPRADREATGTSGLSEGRAANAIWAAAGPGAPRPLRAHPPG